MHVIGLIIIIRLVLLVVNRGGSSSTLNPTRTWSFLWRGASLLVASVLFSLGGMAQVFSCLVVAALVVPSFTAYYLIVPWGVPHCAYGFIRVVCLGFGGADSKFYELCARARFGRGLEPEKLRRYKKQIQNELDLGLDSDTTVRGATIASLAMLDVQEGNFDSARELFAIAMNLPRFKSSPGTRETSQAWLLADALGRGDYADVLILSTRGPSTWRRLLFRQIARRALGLSSRWPLGIFVPLFLSSPAPLMARAVQKRANRLPVLVALSEPAHGLDGARSALFEALARPRGAVTRAELRAIASAWFVLESTGALELQLSESESLLDVNTVHYQFMNDAVDLLMALWRCSLPEKAPPEEEAVPLILQVIDSLERELLGEIESIAEGLPVSECQDDLHLEEQWREWAHFRALVDTYLSLVPGGKERVIEEVRAELINHGVWLYNEKKAYFFAHEVWRWVLTFTPQHHEDYKLVRDNVRLASSC